MGTGWELTCTRSCHYQLCIVYIEIKGGLGGPTYSSIVGAIMGGGGPKQRGCLHIIVSIRARNPRNQRISCKGPCACAHLVVACCVPAVSAAAVC